MSEYICNTEDKCGMCEAYRTAEPIIRCRDCEGKDYCEAYQDYKNPNGFCAWGESAWVTCECGEDIERHDRIQTCPSCGRKVMA